MTLYQTQTSACRLFRSLYPRASEYACDVIMGLRAWSGADLQGKAKKYGRSYAVQRNRAAECFDICNGVRVRANRRIVSAVYLCMDDYGNAVYQSTIGIVVNGRVV